MVADQCWYPSPHQHRFLDRASNRPPPRLLYIHRRERFLALAQKSAGQCPRATPWIGGLPPSQTASFASPTLPLLPPSFSAERGIIVPVTVKQSSSKGPWEQ